MDEEGRLLGPFALMALAPDAGGAVQQLGALIRFGTSLRDADRELAILMVAVRRRCGFEWFAHEGAARHAGLSDDTRADLRSGRQPGGLDARSKAVWTATHEMIALDALSADGYVAAVAAIGESMLAELTWLVGYYSMLALALAVFDPEQPIAARNAFEEGAVGIRT